MGGIDAADANANPNERQLEASEAYDVFNAGGHERPVRAGHRRRRRRARRDRATRRSRRRSATSSPQLQGVRRAARRRPDADLRPAGRPVRGAAGGRPRLARRVDRPDRRPDRRRRRPGHAAHRAGPADPRRRPDGAAPTLAIHVDQQHVHQRRHQRADLERPRRLAAAHDPADVHHPAVRVRGDRRRRSCRWSWRSPRSSPRSGSSASTARSSGRSARTRRS